MSVLRSVSALQMYQRAVRGPIDGLAVVRFLLSVLGVPAVGAGLPRRHSRRAARLARRPIEVIAVLDDTEAALAASDPDVTAGRELDRAMEATSRPRSLELDRAIHDRYVASRSLTARPVGGRRRHRCDAVAVTTGDH